MDYLTFRLYVEIIHENMVKLFYTTYISVDFAHHEIFHAKVGKDGISTNELDLRLTLSDSNLMEGTVLYP